TGEATQYQANSGLHKWFTAPSGTAGNAISFTQAMTLDASGRQLVGLTSSRSNNARLQVKRTDATVGASTYSIGWLQNATGYEDGLDVKATDGVTILAADYAGTNHGTNLVFATNNSAGAFSATERARITSGGNLLVGETSDYLSTRLLVDSASTDNSTNILTLRDSGDTERFRVRSDGYTYAGFYPQTTGSAANVFIGAGGDLLRSTSSLKYKRDVQDAIHGLAEVMALRSVTYKGKSENDGDKIFGGLIAEEVHAAGLTEFVQYAEDGTPDALAYGNMVSLCIKAIQEQQTLIESLTSRVAQLEGTQP
ncbi:MAG: tail fiber domain-containing protein, partial [Betaproteobacteria bacterium]|nr:tail fiber domain-containing protein [Betaproteobacteria bacterium]